MRLSVGLVTLVASCTILSGLIGSASAQAAEPAASHSKDWIRRDPPPPVSPGVDYGNWSQQDQQPVLLPLPAEGWAGAGVLLSFVVYRGVKRARRLALSR